MWNRKEIKAKGKAAFQANYWRCVLVALIVVCILGSGAAANKRSADSAADQVPGYQQSSSLVKNPITELKEVLAALSSAQRNAVVGVIAAAVGGTLLVFVLIDVLLINPLEVGCRRFFLVNSDRAAELNELGYGFKSNFGNVVKTILLRDVYLFLWALLFVIPAIVKAYSYALVPYILADDPSMSPKDAITCSRTMMNGNKWKAFMLDLSFIGWDILAVVTAGLVGVFYSNPYQCAAHAEMYKAIRSAQRND